MELEYKDNKSQLTQSDPRDAEHHVHCVSELYFADNRTTLKHSV